MLGDGLAADVVEPGSGAMGVDEGLGLMVVTGDGVDSSAKAGLAGNTRSAQHAASVEAVERRLLTG
ncbi:MAG TPA: hypothetical protein DDY88_04425 [Actinobacteria bacterium]|nr:hypothetical protein [Actinomycetota bacterium]